MRTPKAERKAINIVLGANLRAEREKQNLTREAFAEKIDVSARFLADIEGGYTGVSLTTLKDICTVLGCSADTLLGIGAYNSEDAERFALKCCIDTMSIQTVRLARIVLPEIDNAVTT